MSNYKLMCVTCTLYSPSSTPCPFVTELNCVNGLTLLKRDDYQGRKNQDSFKP